MSLSLWLGKLRETAREGTPRILDSHIEAALIEVAEAAESFGEKDHEFIGCVHHEPLRAALSRLQALAEREASG